MFADHTRALLDGRRFRPVNDGVPEPLLRYWVGAPTYSLTRVAQQELTKVFAASGWAPKWEGLAAGIYQRCWLGTTGVLIEFKSGDNPSSLVSVPTHGQWWDEGAKLKPSVWQGNARQRLTDTAGWALFTSTPMGPGFYQDLFSLGADESSRWYDPTCRDDEWESVHWTTADNPHPLVRTDVEHARKTLPKRYFDREYLASFDAYQGQVYEEFDTHAHVREWTGGAFDRRFGGVDFGHGAPGAIVVLGARQARDGTHYHAIDEHHSARMATHEWTQRAYRLAADHRVTDYYADPAGAQQIRDWSDAGLPMRTHRRVNDVSAGIRVVASLLASKRLTISPKCVNLIREIKAYRYREDSAGNSTDQVVKENDHGADALRYGIFADHLQYDALRSAA